MSNRKLAAIVFGVPSIVVLSLLISDGRAQTQSAAPQPAVIDCGTGTASAKANLTHPASGVYALTATVVNESTKAIELDSLVVTADYGAAGKKQFVVQVSGRQIDARPGQAEVTFDIPESAGSSVPNSSPAGSVLEGIEVLRRSSRRVASGAFIMASMKVIQIGCITLNPASVML